jgi:hypothetical protein
MKFFMAFPKRQYANDIKKIAFFKFSCSMVFCPLFLHVIGENLNAIYSKNIPDATLLFILCSPLNAVSNTINPSALSTGLCVHPTLFLFQEVSLLLFTKPFALQHILYDVYCLCKR